MWQEDQCHVSVRDEGGRPRPDWAEILQKETSELRAPGERHQGSIRLPETLRLSDRILAVEAIAFQDRRSGLLGMGVMPNAPSEVSAATRTLLAMCAQQLSLRLQLEIQERDRSRDEELVNLNTLANVGELVGPLAHEFNNILNTLLLQTAVLGAKAPKELRADLATIRQQGNSLAALVKQVQQYRRALQPKDQHVDLNRILKAVTEELSRNELEASTRILPRILVSEQTAQPSQPDRESVNVRLALAPKLPPVLGSVSDLKRLFRFLLRNAVAVVPPGGTVSVRTELLPGKVFAAVEDTGPSISPQLLAQLFEAGLLSREGTNSLELTACKNLVKRLQGSIRAENRADGGVAILLELPATENRE
jgi:signal transduction histidine kinase